MDKNLNYLTGFGNHFSSEALENSLPKNQNSPQKVPYGLYTEQLSGSAFTEDRHSNLRTWLYRICPSVLHSEYKLIPQGHWLNPPFNEHPQPPTQLRWNPIPYPNQPVDFVNGIITMAGHGNIIQKTGGIIYHYAITQSMDNTYFYNSDGELIFVPEDGALLIKTELGFLHVEPTEIAVIPRGMKFQVCLVSECARGYLCENHGRPFQLPNLGPIGSNGLADPRHFKVPVASYEEKKGDFKLISKYLGNLFEAQIKTSPLDVVAWHGNYVPYKYDLTKFNTINTVSFDHPDPSIFTVLTSPSSHPGVANIDFVIFPERWMVAEHTFRPPYYHRNTMSEYMGLIKGQYDAKESGFIPGGASLHNCMTAHGPDTHAYHQAIDTELKPVHYKETLAFMFESASPWEASPFALTTELKQKDYLSCWEGLEPDKHWFNS